MNYTYQEVKQFVVVRKRRQPRQHRKRRQRRRRSNQVLQFGEPAGAVDVLVAVFPEDGDCGVHRAAGRHDIVDHYEFRALVRHLTRKARIDRELAF